MADPQRLYTKFKTAKGFYVYDTYSNHILSLSAATWDGLEGALAALDGDHAAPELADVRRTVDEAIASGFLRMCDITSMGFFANDDDLLSRVKQYVSQLTLEVTERCNNRCHYCYYTYDATRTDDGHEMSWRTATNAIRLFAEVSTKAETRAVSFWGGEPLLRFSFIRRVIDYVNTHYPQMNVHYAFTTNGTIFTREIVRCLMRTV